MSFPISCPIVNDLNVANSNESEYIVRCHCGKVEASFWCSNEKITAWDCNCSDCSMRGNVHFMVTRLRVMSPNYLDETTLYEWGTKTAKRRFCKTCGILPFYTPRSNPNGFGVTLKCVDFGANGPDVEIKHYDGVNWEKSYSKTGIAKETALEPN